MCYACKRYKISKSFIKKRVIKISMIMQFINPDKPWIADTLTA